MKNITYVLLSVMLISGCVTAPLSVGYVDINNKSAMVDIFDKHKDWDEKTKDSFINGKLQIGMTSLQVLYLQKVPIYWSRHKIGDDTYETWSLPWVGPDHWTCDFKNGILTGYSMKARYYSSEGIDDLRALK